MSSSTPFRLTGVQWLVCTIAAIGFAFDIYELLMLPLIIKPAMASLSAPLIEQMVASGVPRPEAMQSWLPGGVPNYAFWANSLLRPRAGRWRIRTDWRLVDRSTWTSPRSDIQYPPVCVWGFCRWLRHKPSVSPDLSMLRIRGCVC